MSIAVECPGCRARFEVPDRLYGKRIRCLTCREDFPVAGAPSGHGYETYEGYDDDASFARFRRTVSPERAVLVVGGILGFCAVIAVGAVALWAVFEPDKSAPPGQQRSEVMMKMSAAPRRAINPNGVIPRAFVTPAREKLGWRPADPVEGPILLTLSNPRRAESALPGRPAYQVDYQVLGAATNGSGWTYYLVVKVPPGAGEALLPRLSLADEPHGTLSFAFFPGHDPKQGFDLWVEREPVGTPAERHKVSKPVTLD
jgi:hypothetical protein